LEVCLGVLHSVVPSMLTVLASHTHWDHMGNMGVFDGKTDLVVGPGFKEHFIGAQTPSPLGAVIPTDIEGRRVHEIGFRAGDANVVQIGQFSAYDYFQDGSFYLIDSPGHCVGHLCALARTSTSPDTFVFLGGDVAHHCGELRPSRHVPLPETISPSPLPGAASSKTSTFTPKEWFSKLQASRNRDANTALYQPAFGHNMDQVLESIAKTQEYDGDDHILVLLAHDAAFRDPSVPKLPEALNDWHSRRLGEKFRWTWIGDVWRESQDSAWSCCS
jgi:glyoxylase-like metal-dependent hydrolase (beta-lactamase superfamily II)